MNVLEKILEEMKKIKDGNRKEKLYGKYPPQNKRQETLNAYSQGYEDGTDNFYNAIIPIIRSHMDEASDMHGKRLIDEQPTVYEANDWIPVEERLPNEEEFKEAYCRNKYAAEFVVMIEGATRPTTLYYKNGSWFDEERNYYSVVAWQPLPEPYIKNPK